MLILSTIFFILLGAIIGCLLAKLTFLFPKDKVPPPLFKIPSRSLFIISITAAAFAICWIFVPPQKALLGMLFASYLIWVATSDIEHLMIPNNLTLYGFIFALILSALFPILHNPTSNLGALSAAESFLSALAGAFIGSGCLLWIALIAEAVLGKESLGMGDIKLMGALGAFCGWKGSLFAIFGGSLIATILILPYQAIKRFSSKKGTLKGDAHIFENGIYAQQFKSSARRTSGEADGAYTRYVTKPNPDVQQRGNLKCDVYIPFGFWLALASFLYFIWFEHPFEEYFQAIIDIYSIRKFL